MSHFNIFFVFVIKKDFKLKRKTDGHRHCATFSSDKIFSNCSILQISNVWKSHTEVNSIDLRVHVQDKVHLEWLTFTVQSRHYDTINKTSHTLTKLCPKKKKREHQHFVHNCNKFKRIVVIFGKQHDCVQYIQSHYSTNVVCFRFHNSVTF